MDGAKEETGAAEDDVDVLMMFNSDTRSRLFYLPPAPHNGRWHLALDTGQPPPLDIHPVGQELGLEPTMLIRQVFSMVVWFSGEAVKTLK
jgi:hypothetical protein